MDWWVWVIIVVVVLAILAGAVLAIQARRRKGGVIVDPGRSPRTGGPDGRR